MTSLLPSDYFNLLDGIENRLSDLELSLHSLSGSYSGGPTGVAGGVLTGFYPNPGIASNLSLPGVPSAATAAPGNNSTQLATTAFVTAATAAIDLTPYVKRDGSRSFTSRETFDAGLDVVGSARWNSITGAPAMTATAYSSYGVLVGPAFRAPNFVQVGVDGGTNVFVGPNAINFSWSGGTTGSSLTQYSNDRLQLNTGIVLPVLWVLGTSTSVATSIIQAAPSQTIDLTQWKDGSAVVQTRIDRYGELLTQQALKIGPSAGTTDVLSGIGANLLIQPFNTGAIGMAIKGYPGQTADLTQWHGWNYGGYVALRVTSEGDLQFDGNIGDSTISIGAAGNPYPNVSRNLILRPQFIGAVRIQSGMYSGYHIDIEPTGGFTWTQSTPAMTIMDVPTTGGNGQYNVYWGGLNLHMEGASMIVRGRSETTANLTLGDTVGWAGNFGPGALSIGSRGVATAITDYNSYGFQMSASKWIGSVAGDIVSYQYVSGAFKQYRFGVWDTAAYGNQSGGTRVMSMDTDGNFIYNGDYGWGQASYPNVGLVVENFSNTNPPLLLNARPFSSSGGWHFYGGGASPVLKAKITGSGQVVGNNIDVRVPAGNTATLSFGVDGGNSLSIERAAGATAFTLPASSIDGSALIDLSVPFGKLQSFLFGGGNRLYNSSFEAATYSDADPAFTATAYDGWTISGVVTVPAGVSTVGPTSSSPDNARVIYGTAGNATALKLTSNASGTITLTPTTARRPAVQAGVKLAGTVYVGSDTAALQGRLRFRFYDSTNTEISSSSIQSSLFTIPSSGMLRYYMHGATGPTTPANTVFTALELDLVASASGQKFYVDGLQLESSDYATSYAPNPQEILPGFIDATAIRASAIYGDAIAATLTVTGKVIQTDTSGARVVMDGNNDRLQIINSSNVLRTQLDTDGITLYDTSGVQGLALSQAGGLWQQFDNGAGIFGKIVINPSIISLQDQTAIMMITPGSGIVLNKWTSGTTINTATYGNAVFDFSANGLNLYNSSGINVLKIDQANGLRFFNSSTGVLGLSLSNTGGLQTASSGSRFVIDLNGISGYDASSVYRFRINHTSGISLGVSTYSGGALSDAKERVSFVSNLGATEVVNGTLYGFNDPIGGTSVRLISFPHPALNDNDVTIGASANLSGGFGWVTPAAKGAYLRIYGGTLASSIVGSADGHAITIIDNSGSSSFGQLSVAQTWSALNTFTGGLTVSTQETRTNPTLSTNWSNFGSGNVNAAYWKDSLGYVHLEGVIVKSTTITSGDTLFTLSAGYRPAAVQNFAVACADGGSTYRLVIVAIDTGGVVKVYFSGSTPASSSWLTLSGLLFRL